MRGSSRPRPSGVLALAGVVGLAAVACKPSFSTEAGELAGSEVRVLVTFSGAASSVVATASEPLNVALDRAELEAHGAEVWALGYSLADLRAAYPGFEGRSPDEVAASLGVKLGEPGRSCARPEPHAVRRISVSKDGELVTAPSDVASWRSAESASAGRTLVFEPAPAVACGVAGAAADFCAPRDPPAAEKALRLVEGSRQWIGSDEVTALPVGAAPRTLEMWVVPDPCKADENGGALGGYGRRSAPAAFFQIELCQRGQISVQTGAGGGAGTWWTGIDSARIRDGRWHHLAATFDGSNTLFYVDGAVAAKTSTAAFDTRSEVIELGRDILTASRQFLGWLDEPRIWARALSPTEIRERMHLFPPPGDGLSGSWSFSETAATARARDSSGNDNDLGVAPVGRELSFAPVGDGAAASAPITAPGKVALPAAGVSLDVTSVDGPGPHEVTVTKLHRYPARNATDTGARAQPAWIVRSSGRGEIRFGMTIDLGGAHLFRAGPDRLQLVSIAADKEGVTFDELGGAASAGAESATFAGPLSDGVYTIRVKAPAPCCLFACEAP